MVRQKTYFLAPLGVKPVWVPVSVGIFVRFIYRTRLNNGDNTFHIFNL